MEIDRTNKQDLFIQTGRTEEKVCNLNRKIAKIDIEINSMPKRLIHLEFRKKIIALKISKHEKYIMQLDNDINKL